MWTWGRDDREAAGGGGATDSGRCTTGDGRRRRAAHGARRRPDNGGRRTADDRERGGAVRGLPAGKRRWKQREEGDVRAREWRRRGDGIGGVGNWIGDRRKGGRRGISCGAEGLWGQREARGEAMAWMDAGADVWDRQNNVPSFFSTSYFLGVDIYEKQV
jgi:hypothetical protein